MNDILDRLTPPRFMFAIGLFGLGNAAVNQWLLPTSTFKSAVIAATGMVALFIGWQKWSEEMDDVQYKQVFPDEWGEQ